MTAAFYRFCDAALSLTADRASAITDFDRMYGAFREPVPPRRAGVTCHLRTDESGRGQVLADGRTHELAMPDPGSAYALWIVWEAVASASRTHFFFHASAVSLNDRVVLFAGATGRGKSTLAAAVVGNGGRPLNDDITPVERATGIAEHFPKGQPDTPPRPQDRRPVSAVIFLGPAHLDRQLHIAIDRLPERWRDRPPWEPSWQVVANQRTDHWELQTRSAPPGAGELLRDACSFAGVTILRDLRASEPSFSTTPQLRSIPPVSALPRLVGELFGRGKRPTTGLAWELAATFAKASFWELVPGPPQATAQAVIRALRNDVG